MLRTLIALATVAALLLAGTALVVSEAPRAQAAATKFEIDASHSAILFRLTHHGVSAAYGRFNGFKGSFALDGDSAATSSVTVEVDASTVDTGHAGRDKHLRGPDFFNVGEHKTITFTSTRVSKTTSPKHFDVTGKLTLHGATKEVTIRMEKIGERDLGERFGYRAGFEGTLRIKRTDFGMGWGVDKGSLGDEVKLTLAFEGVKK